MTLPVIAVIVEGHGEVDAIPGLLRRIAAEAGFTVQVRKPHRMTSSEMHTDRLGAVARIQSVATRGTGGFLVVLFDLDDHTLDDVERAAGERLGEFEHVVGVAVREYEAWLLAGVDTVSGSSLVKDDIAAHPNPESPRNAKKALSSYLTVQYKETVHQSALTAQIDLQVVAQRAPSFAEFRERIVSALKAGAR